jgi:hypothetical protein
MDDDSDPPEPPPEVRFQWDFDDFIAALARTFVHQGNAAAVAVLSEGNAAYEYKGRLYNSNYGGHLPTFDARLDVAQAVFNSVIDRIFNLETELREQAEILMRRYPEVYLRNFVICPQYVKDPDWRLKAKAWLKGEGVNNQGRVRSDNIAPYTKDGLLFRSKPEINLYQALKARGITFSPLPVFIRGGDNYRRVEPDFVIWKNGKFIVIELDGTPFHTETPVEAHERTIMFNWEGAHIERISAAECDTPEKAERIANQIQALINKLLANK